MSLISIAFIFTPLLSFFLFKRLFESYWKNVQLLREESSKIIKLITSSIYFLYFSLVLSGTSIVSIKVIIGQDFNFDVYSLVLYCTIGFCLNFFVLGISNGLVRKLFFSFITTK